MKFLIKSTTLLNRGLYYTDKRPFFTSNKAEATIYTELPRGIYKKDQARLVYVYDEHSPS